MSIEAGRSVVGQTETFAGVLPTSGVGGGTDMPGTRLDSLLVAEGVEKVL